MIRVRQTVKLMADTVKKSAMVSTTEKYALEIEPPAGERRRSPPSSVT